MSEVPSPIIHFKSPAIPGRTACSLRGTVTIESTRKPADVTCHVCKRQGCFKVANKGVETPTPLRDVVAETPELQRLSKDALKACRNERGMYVIEESIHHGDYRSTRRVEVFAINMITVDAVIQSSAYNYESWNDPHSPHYEARSTKLRLLVEDLKALRTNRMVGWSTFRILTGETS